jgi:hypothetical protein
MPKEVMSVSLSCSRKSTVTYPRWLAFCRRKALVITNHTLALPYPLKFVNGLL